MTFPTRKTQALLIYLVVEGSQQTRERLASLLWPESNTERSYASLRNTLNRLKTVFHQAGGQDLNAYLTVTNTTLGLAPGACIELDLEIIERAYALATIDRSSQSSPDDADNLSTLMKAAASQRGEFLAGFTLGDADSFDDWVTILREDWHRRLGQVFDRLSEILFARGDFTEATEVASRWINLDPLNETAYRRKMRISFAAGERGKALEVYEACRNKLADELGIEPEPDTNALAERIRKQVTSVQPIYRRSAGQQVPAATSVDFLGSLFTGRNTENQSLVSSFTRASQGQPQLVVLRGEAGIGKTRLVSKFLAWAGAQGAELLHGSTFESGIHFPFQPLVDAFRLRLGAGKPVDDQVDEVWLDALGQLLPEFRRRDRVTDLPNREPGPLEAELSQSQLFEALVQLLLALASQAPLVLFIDDLQWADRATLDLLHYAVRRWQDIARQAGGARILLVVSLRNEALLPVPTLQQAGESPGLIQWLSRVERELAPVHLELQPLGEMETEQMVLSILSPPSVDFARWLYTETHGHPYYMIETLKDLLERRVLRPKRQAEGNWTFSVSPEHDFSQAARVPTTVQAVIRSRLNRLSPNAFSVLAAGAVLDQQLTFEHLVAIANVDEERALPGLDELVSGRLLLETGVTGAPGEYMFVNDMLRDVVYTEAGEARRRLFHRRALEMLEAKGASPAVLAHHALAAGLLQEAFQHSLSAGRAALRLSAVSEAVVHLERALRLVTDGSLPEMPEKTVLQDLYKKLRRAYELDGAVEKAQAVEEELKRMG